MGTAIAAVRSPAVLQKTRPRFSTALYMVSDMLTLLLAWATAVSVRLLAGGDFTIGWYLSLSPMLAVCLVAFAMRGLYPGNGIDPVEQFRRFTLSISMVYSTLVVFTFFEKQAETYSRVVFLIAWLLSVALLPLSRAAIRNTIGSQKWWGTPVVILGAGPTARSILRLLSSDPGLGFRVQAVLGADYADGELDGVPMLGSIAHSAVLARQLGINTAIVALPDVGAGSLSEVVNKYGMYFSELLIIPDMLGPTNVSIEARGLGQLLTIGVRQNLLLPWPRVCKRLLDMALAVTGGLAMLPFIALIALAVKLSSRGPVFYRQTRIGKDCKPFKAWKFRTMIVNADRILFEHLATNPFLRAEWERDHKLRNDPRITRIGKFLRDWSLDELPQIWNVICGEMSLIGPRPIVSAEVARYANYFEVYTRVLPGITGLWQVSGRSDTDYQKRVELDAYYVHNWSPWLDVYVLARTVEAVLNRRGAY